MLRRLASLILKSPNMKNDYVRTSYSQCGEDIIIDFLFYQIGIEKPGYIDIGAHHPKYINNTYLFYQKGSRGISIEPDPALISQFNSLRKDDINLNIGIGDTNGEADFYIMNEPTLNTFVREEADRATQENAGYQIKEIKKIKIAPLVDVINKYNGGVFPDLLSIDVEGLDEMILKSIDYNSVVPKIMCVETLTFSTKGRGEKKTALIEFIKSKGYMVYADTYINTIFVRENLYRK
ncbi:MAG: FkbM family methyltransferase [Bacteroidota bacterium]|nr:FkbM family methyltransferase [Bacteroidota bacterium]